MFLLSLYPGKKGKIFLFLTVGLIVFGLFNITTLSYAQPPVPDSLTPHELINYAIAQGLSQIGPILAGALPLGFSYLRKHGIKIDKEETLETLKDFIKKALGFAINIDYATKETITYFIAKASSEEKALSKLVEKPTEEIKVEEKPEEVKEKVEEEKKEDLT